MCAGVNSYISDFCVEILFVRYAISTNKRVIFFVLYIYMRFALPVLYAVEYLAFLSQT